MTDCFDITITTKTCTKCGEPKPLDQFSKFRHAKDGLSPWCKTCASAYNKGYHERNAEKYREARKRDYRENRTARRAANDAWKMANLERHQFLQRRSWLKNNYNLTPEQYEDMVGAGRMLRYLQTAQRAEVTR